MSRFSALWILFSLGMGAASAQESVPSFTDVSAEHPAFAAVEYLKTLGVVQGYADGTYKPDQMLNRAETAKFIVAPRVKQEELAKYTTTPFQDIPAGSWYLPYVEIGRQVLGVIDGPPAKTAFEGTRPVRLVEFLKMLFVAYEVNTASAFSEITLPLGGDVTDVDAWYYDRLRYAMTASMIMADASGMLQPAKELTRGDVAILLHRFLMYREGRRTQALLSEAESEILGILNFLGQNDIARAEYASARALLAARGAHASKPDVPVVKAALKITEAFRALVRGYRAGLHGDFENVIALSRDAYGLADQAVAFSPAMATIAEQLRKSAHDMAESARTLKAGGAGSP